jgi:transitional endoplasmic reticulum ATPase
VPLAEFDAVQFCDEPLTLCDLLRRAPSLSLDPIDSALLGISIERITITKHAAEPSQRLYCPPGLQVRGVDGRPASPNGPAAPPPETKAPLPQPEPIRPPTEVPPDAALNRHGFPEHLDERTAVVLAYSREIERVASFLRAGLSVLVECDKAVVKHLWREIARKARCDAKVLEVPDEEEGGLVPRGLRQRQMAKLKELIRSLKIGDVLVIPHLDLLAGGTDNNLAPEARELTELLYDPGTAKAGGVDDRLLMAFVDPSLAIPEVLASRFSVRFAVRGVHREIIYPDGAEKLLGEALVTKTEASRFIGFDPAALYKNVAGMNPIRLRHALTYAVKEHAVAGPVSVDKLVQALREFKAQTSAKFEVPLVKFRDIGGYEEVKAEIERALRLIAGGFRLPDPELQRELIPRGFIFYGPPGTGKTLFAKAIANRLNATILVVSGPEVTDMYVGESERKVREIFAEARRNAPSVVVFDEFDSIATRRSGRDDGGSRAGNALVAQILTEMDGFRPDVPMLVIGTTNRLDIIDEALLRPSRFQAIPIGLPDRVARRAIAVVHSDHFKIPLSAALLDVIADKTEGFNGDEIRSLFRDAYVGLHCEEPPRAADARRFGQLVGRLRAARQQRDTESTNRRGPTQGAPLRPGERPRPSGSMITLNPALAPNVPTVVNPPEGTAP